jgi:hypothetical protein
VSVFITGGESEQLIAYEQFDVDYKGSSEFGSAELSLEANIPWQTKLNIRANRAFQANEWSTLYSVGLLKAISQQLGLAASAQAQNTNLGWLVSIKYQF